MPRLLLFGGLTLEGRQGPITGRAAQQRRLALLALLAAEHPRPFSRDKVIALLWPESDTAHARQLLRQALFLNGWPMDFCEACQDELREAMEGSAEEYEGVHIGGVPTQRDVMCCSPGSM